MSLELELVVLLKSRFEEMRNKAKADISEGICQDMREYGFSLGYVRGLHDAVTIMLEVEEDLIKGKE